MVNETLNPPVVVTVYRTSKIYELGRISSGVAAKLAGVPRTVFFTKLADYGVDTFQLTEEEIQVESRLAGGQTLETQSSQDPG